MIKPNATDLLFFFEIAKPAEMLKPGEQAATSKPNLDKVPVVTRSFYLGLLSANSGMGTQLAVGLDLLKLASTAILSSVDDKDFDATKATIGVQIGLLADTIKGLSQQQAKATLQAFSDQLKALKKKAQAAQGAVGVAQDGQPMDPDAPMPELSAEQQAEAEAAQAATDLEAQLVGAFGGDKKKETIN